jgi:hypothetical protein
VYGNPILILILKLSVTGCIDPLKVDRLNPGDGGGQYDSSGGAGHMGNPQGSACLGYNHYVEVRSSIYFTSVRMAEFLNSLSNRPVLALALNAAMILPIVPSTRVCFRRFFVNFSVLISVSLADQSGCPAVIPGNYFNCG